MNSKVLKLLMIASKQACYIFLFSLVSMQTLLAYHSSGQHLEKVLVSVQLQQATPLEVIRELEKQTDFIFGYDRTLSRLKTKIDLDFEKQSMAKVLRYVARETGLKFRQINNNISVMTDREHRKKRTSKVLEIDDAYLIISGKVSDEQGQPLPGTNVFVKGTTIGTTTDADGGYRLSVPDDATTLVFSYIGYVTEEVAIGGRTVIDMALYPDVTTLDDLVVIGYGTQKKSDLTGAQASVGPEDLEGHPVFNFAQVLQGRVPGVVISNTSGSPGQAPKIRIRGANSISGGNEPLYVVDGFVSDFNNVNVNDIETIDILKDASATAIYGSRGANGVILITTKSGTAGETRINAFSNVSFTQLENKYDLMDPAEYAGWINDYFDQSVFSEDEIEAFRQGAGTDWQDEIMQTGLIQNHQVSISGGAKNIRYYIAGNVLDEEGILINTGRQKYTLRANFNTELSDRLSLDFNVNAVQDNRKNAQLAFGGSKEDPVWNSIIWSPTEPIFNPDGTYNRDDTYGSLLKNPYMYATESMQDDRRQTLSLNSNIQYDITNNLSFDVIGGFNKSANEFASFENDFLDISTGAIRRYDDVFDWQLTTMLNYSKQFGTEHNLSVLGGYEVYENTVRWFSANARNLAVNSVAYHNLSLGESQLANSGFSKWSLMSYFTRVNYSYRSKYFFTGTYRADGSSKFREDNRFGFFPSLAFSWAISEEPFVRDLGVFDNLKLRTSWGVTGNQAIAPYSTLAVLQFRGYSYTTGTLFPGYGPAIPPNPNLQWEETRQANIGLDMALMDERVTLTFDFFQKNTDGLLTERELPLFGGMGRRASTTQNLGEIKNTGFEVNLMVNPIARQEFNWDVNFNVSRVRNEVIDIGDQERISGGRYAGGLLATSPFIVTPGQPLGTFFGYRFLGVWGTDEAAEAEQFGNRPGDSKYEDTNNDGKIGPEDFQIIGDANPDFTWGINNTWRFKNFEFNLLLEGVHGGDIFNVTYATAAAIANDTRSITLREATNYWTPENQNTIWPDARSETNVSHMNSSKWIQDGSFVKVRNVSVAYTLPADITNIGNIRLMVSGQNLFTFTDYKGFDPEVSSTGNSDIDSGLDFGVYPNPRIITVGASLEF